MSGLLVPTMGGKGVKPYQPPNIWEPVGFGNSKHAILQTGPWRGPSTAAASTPFLKRTAPPPFMASFDAPNREQSCSIRGRSNTPLQALQLMNDIQHVEAARNLAQRILKEGGETDEDRIQWAWQSVTSRIPDPEDVAIASEALKTHRERYLADEAAATALVTYGESKPDPTIPQPELAAWTMAANLLLNLDETLNK